MSANTNVLITGGAGFIGSHLAVRLLERGHTVRVLDDFSSGRRSNLESVVGRIDLIEGDIRHRDVCDRACAGTEFVLHHAAIGSVPKSVETPVESHDVNANGTLNLLMAARQARVRRFIYAGSSSAYGDSDVSPKHEGLVPNPLSPYAAQKLLGEHYARAFCECYGLETITLRYFNVFGPRQDPHSSYAAAIPAFVTSLLRGQSPIVYGDGRQSRDFTHIDNVVHGNVLAMEMGRSHGEVVNVACGAQITINEVIATINRILGTCVEPRHVAPRTGDVRHSSADIRRARALLGFTPVVAFEEGLRDAIEHYRSADDGPDNR